MKTAMRRMLACALASCLLCLFVADSNAGWFDKDTKGITDPRIAAGLFSGKLSGDIKVENKSFQVTPNTLVYVVGEGQSEDYGMRLLRRPLAVRGELIDGVMVAHTIIVRPRDSHLTRSDRSERILSKNNPNVGIAQDSGE